MDAPTAPLPRNLLDALREAGIDPAMVARQVQVEPERLESGVTAAEADRFLCAAWVLVDDPAFGLRAGQIMRPERFGLSGVLAMASPTFEVALMRKARYGQLVWGDRYEVASDANEFTVSISTPGEARPYGQAKIDMELTSLLAFGRRFTGVTLFPLRVSVRQAAPSYRATYVSTFECPVEFGQRENSITFRRRDTDLKLLSANPEASDWLELGARSALERMEQSSMAERLGRQIERMLQGDEPTLDSAAAQLCMSGRTLQRRLAEEGLSFSKLLDQTRKSAALRRLAHAPINVMELAFLLGFTDPNSFYRAFKRWTGTTPETYRKGRAAGLMA